MQDPHPNWTANQAVEMRGIARTKLMLSSAIVLAKILAPRRFSPQQSFTQFLSLKLHVAVEMPSASLLRNNQRDHAGEIINKPHQRLEAVYGISMEEDTYEIFI